MSTEELVPTKDFVEATIRSSKKALNHLWKARFNSRKATMYMIVGIKSVTGASCKRMKSKGHSEELGVKVDGGMLSGGMAPIGLGPSLSNEASKTENGGFGGSDAFVFAYRLIKIVIKEKYSKASDGLIVAFEDFAKGAMYDEQSSENSIDPLATPSFEIVEIEEGGILPKKGYILSDEFVDEGDEIVQIVKRQL